MPFDLSPRVVVAMLLFVAFSILVGSALGGAGGWRSLAERYPASRAGDPEERHRFASLRTSGGLVGSSSYANCVMMGIGLKGISVALWAPFALFHPPFFLPWTAVEWWRTVEYPGGRKVVQLTVRDGGSLTFFGRAGSAIAEHARRLGLAEGKPDTAWSPAPEHLKS